MAKKETKKTSRFDEKEFAGMVEAYMGVKTHVQFVNDMIYGSVRLKTPSGGVSPVIRIRVSAWTIGIDPLNWLGCIILPRHAWWMPI